MRFEWDEAKAAANLAKHGVAFPDAAFVFADPAHRTIDASRADDGEARLKAVGMVAGRLMTVVFTIRTKAVRLISARRANDKERRAYGSGPVRV